MRRFSKHDNQAICNYCGKWQPTDLTNQQLEEMDWKCDECKAKEQPAAQPQKVTPPESDRGSKEISKYDPEYAFLVKLVKLVTTEGVPPQEIKSIADAYPFVTVDDVGDLTAKIWTLATEKYHIPREWLISKLPKNASLKITAKGYRPPFEDLLRMITDGYLQDNWADQPGDINNGMCENFVYQVRKIYPEAKPVYIRMENPNGPMHAVLKYNGKFYDSEAPDGVQNLKDIQFVLQWPKNTPIYTNNPNGLTAKKADLWRGQEESDDMIDHAPGYLAYEYGQDKTSAEFTGAEFSKDDVGVSPTVDIGPFSSPEDHGAKPQKQPFPNTGWLPADDENQDEQPYSNIASAFKPPFSKKAGLDGRYWIAPDGKEFNAGTHHGAWVNNNLETLKAYGINGAENLSEMYNMMLGSGWTRVSNERGFTIQVADLNRVPAYLDDFIAKHYQKGDVIRIGTDSQMVEIADPFPSLQRAINKALRRTKISQKEADLSGQTVNQIVNALHANGGVTWNLSQGNMVGTDNYAVAIYPERAQILDGADFDRIEEYIISNSDLLDNSENSFGAWSHDGKVYLDVVATVPDINKAVELGKQHNQIAIWDLKNAKQISTGGTGEVKQASQNQVLPQPLQDQIAAETSPAYNIALNNYAQAVRRGHEKDRSLEYAIESVSNIDKIDPKKLVELINQYL